jgi:hypothetical protein
MGSFGGGLETVGIEFDPRSILQGIERVNQDLQTLESGSEKATGQLQRDWTSVVNVLTRVSDRSKNAADSYIRSLEKQAAAVGKSGIDKLNAQMEQAIKNYGYSASAIEKITAAYEKLRKAQEPAEHPGEKFKEFGEGIKEFIESPAQGAQGALVGLFEKIGPVGVALGATVGVAAALGAGMFEIVEGAGRAARELDNLAKRTGLSTEEAERLSIAANLSGVNIGSLEKSAVGLSKALEDSTGAGKGQAKALEELGIATHTFNGAQKEEGEILLEVLTKLSEIPETAKRVYEAQLLLGKGAKELQPMIQDLPRLREEAEKLSASLGTGVNEQLLKADSQIRSLDTAWEVFKKNLAAKISPIVIPVVYALGNALAGHPDAPQQQRWIVSLGRHRTAEAARYTALLERGLPLPGGYFAAGAYTNPAVIQSLSNYTESIRAGDSLGQQLKAQHDSTKSGLEELLSEQSKIEKENYAITQQSGVGIEAKTEAQKKMNAAIAQEEQIRQRIKDLEDSGKQVKQYVGPVEGQEIIQYHQLQQLATAIPNLRNPGNNLEDVKDWFEQYKEQQKEQEAAQKATLSFEEQMIKLRNGPDGELATVKQIYDLRMSAATSVLEQYQAGLDYLKQMAELQSKADQEHQAELDKQAKEQQKMLEKEHDQIAKTASGLYDTLLTHPSNFAHQLGDTLRKKATSSASDQLGEITANILVPGGVKHKDPVQATDLNTQATIQNSQAVMAMTAHLAAQLGVSAPSIPGASGLAGITVPPVAHSGTTSLPYFGASSPLFTGSTSTVSLPLPGGGVVPVPYFGSSAAPSGTASLGNAPAVGGGSGRYGSISSGGTGFSLGSILGGGNPASMIGPGGTSGFAGPVGGLLRIGGSGGGFNLGSLFGHGPNPGPDATLQPGWTGNVAPPPGDYSGIGYTPTPNPDDITGGAASGASTLSTVGGSLANMGASAGIAFGSQIAMHGLTGRDEGTAPGIGWGALGGAMTGAGIGFELGGPLGAGIGAGIGAAAGALAGLGELLAGVMSPQAKAKMYAKQLYGITINDNMQNQIVNIANQSYGGNIQLAVRSPQVRQMLGLYAAGTGQSNAKALMNSTPHSAGLSEMNGTLYQDASYLYGNSYKYQSNLPTLGGNNSTTTYNSPNGYAGSSSPQTISLGGLSVNIDGKGSADFLAGNVVTDDFVQQQWSSSQMYSNGRVSNSALIQDPGLITA